jgi:hypothetical protein
MDELDAVLAEIPDEEPESPAVEASTDSVEPVEPKYAELDALLPDAEDVDESLRGKPLAEVVRVASQWKHESKVAAERNQKWNEMESRERMALAAVEWAKQQLSERQQPAPQRGETEDEFLQRLANKPTQVLPEVIDQRVAPMANELRQTRVELENMRAAIAQEQARAALEIDPETFHALKPAMAAFMYANQWPTHDPQAWYAAGHQFKEMAQRFAPAPAPAVTVPKPATPPGGAARSQVRPSSAPKLRGRDRENAVDLASAFGISPDSPAFAQFETEVASIANRRES